MASIDYPGSGSSYGFLGWFRGWFVGDNGDLLLGKKAMRATTMMDINHENLLKTRIMMLDLNLKPQTVQVSQVSYKL